jgi:hypothetical protein
MSNLSNLRKPKLPAALAAAALGTPLVLAAAPAAAQERPATAPEARVAFGTAQAPSAAPAAAPRYQYTLRLGDAYTTRTQDGALASAQRALAQAQPGDCLVVDRAGRRFLITDAATLRRIRESYAPVEAIGKRMEAQGKQMEEAGKPMEGLGKQMEGLGQQMEAIGRQMEEQAKLLETAVREEKPEAERQAIQERMRALGQQMSAPQQEMHALAQKMREQAAAMRPLAERQREFERQMRAAVTEAEQRTEAVMDAAFQNNLAVEQQVR